MPHPEQVDDLTILDSDGLWRWVGPDWVKRDEQGGYRISSQAFQNRPETNAASFFLAGKVLASGRSPEDLLLGKPGYALIEISAGNLRRWDQILVRDPNEKEEAHILVFGPKSRSRRHHLAESATLIVESGHV